MVRFIKRNGVKIQLLPLPIPEEEGSKSCQNCGVAYSSENDHRRTCFALCGHQLCWECMMTATSGGNKRKECGECSRLMPPPKTIPAYRRLISRKSLVVVAQKSNDIEEKLIAEETPEVAVTLEGTTGWEVLDKLIIDEDAGGKKAGAENSDVEVYKGAECQRSRLSVRFEWDEDAWEATNWDDYAAQQLMEENICEEMKMEEGIPEEGKTTLEMGGEEKVSEMEKIAPEQKSSREQRYAKLLGNRQFKLSLERLPLSDGKVAAPLLHRLIKAAKKGKEKKSGYFSKLGTSLKHQTGEVNDFSYQTVPNYIEEGSARTRIINRRSITVQKHRNTPIAGLTKKPFPLTREKPSHRHSPIKAIQNRSQRFKCFGCPKTFTRYFNLEMHVKAEHLNFAQRTALQASENQESGEETSKKAQLNLINFGSPQKLKKIRAKCFHCKKTFGNIYILQRHLRNVHRPKTEREVHKGQKCRDCGQAFEKRSVLIKHLIEKHGKERPYSCHKCGYPYSMNWYLQRHLSKCKAEAPRPGEPSHLEKKRFDCSQCGQKFCSVFSVKRHQMRAHAPKNERENVGLEEKCGNCNQTFENRSALIAHLKFMHKVQTPFECEICGFPFKRRDQLKQHILSHSTEPVYKGSR